MSCAIEGCKSHTGRKENSTNSSEGLTFHRFPNQEEIKNKWIRRVNRPNWTWKKHSHLCSKHFTPDSFLPNENIKWRRLKSNALPTLYLSDTETLAIIPPMDISDAEQTENASHISTSQTPNLNISVQRNLELLSCITQDCSTSAKLSRPACFHESKNSRTEQELQRVKKQSQCRLKQINILESKNTKLQRELERAKKVSQQRLRKINTMTKQLSRLAKKTDDIYTILVDKLKQENIESEYLLMLENINKNDIIKRLLCSS